MGIVGSDSNLSTLQLVLASKVHNCPQTPHLQANCGDLICCSCGCRRQFSSSLVTQPLRLTLVLPCLSGYALVSVSHPDKMGQKQRRMGPHLLSWAGRREGYGRHKWNVSGGPGAVKAFGMLLQPEAGHALSQRNWPWVVGTSATPRCRSSRKRWAMTCDCSQLPAPVTPGVGPAALLIPASGTPTGPDSSWPLRLQTRAMTSCTSGTQASLSGGGPMCPPLRLQTRAVTSPGSGTHVSLCSSQPKPLWGCRPQLRPAPPRALTNAVS